MAVSPRFRPLASLVQFHKRVAHLSGRSAIRRSGHVLAAVWVTCPTVLGPALAMTTPDHIVYGSDCGVPCTTEKTMTTNLTALLGYDGLTQSEIEAIGHNALRLFPAAAKRIQLRGA